MSLFRKMGKRTFFKRLKEIYLVICILFGVLTVNLFNFQIIQSEKYKAESAMSVNKIVSIEAPRGNIYDAKGVPLAVNIPSYNVTLDSDGDFSYENRERAIQKLFSESSSLNESLSKSEKKDFAELGSEITDKNLALLLLINLLESEGEEIPFSVPIKCEGGFKFEYTTEERVKLWLKNDLGLEEESLNMTAEEVIVYLKNLFDIPDFLPEDKAKKLLSLRYSLYLKRYRKYEDVKILEDASKELVVKISEQSELYPGIKIEVSSKRVYPEGKYFSHILGYTGNISEEEYSEYEKHGYDLYSEIGKSGIEKAFELILSGKEGKEISKVNALGEEILTETKEMAQMGSDIYLTIDAEIQKLSFDSLEEVLKNVLTEKIKTGEISIKEFLMSLVKCQNVDYEKLLKEKMGASFKILSTLKSMSNEALSRENIESLLLKAIDEGKVSCADFFLMLYEEGRIDADADYIKNMELGRISDKEMILKFISENQITPGDTDLDPSSGAVFIADVNSGKVIASVSYPSYDNNFLSQGFDEKYYEKLLKHPLSPLINRPLNERKAPGSALKMAAAAAGLEEGYISPLDEIYDEGIFKKAGAPYAKCWIYQGSGNTHGYVNVSEAIAHSCNYFFYELMHEMESSGANASIEILNSYMEMFGLSEPTGVEIGEASPKMASPEYKKEIVLSQNPESAPSEYKWNEGDSIRAAIGQSLNSFTPAQMTKYISVIANGGKRYKFYMTEKGVDSFGREVYKASPEKEGEVRLSEESLDAIKYGMYLVGCGNEGTLSGIFSGMPIKAGLKSGTAQEDLERPSHVWCVGFAPYDDPEIAFAVMVPFGDAKGSPAAQTAKSILEGYFSLP